MCLRNMWSFRGKPACTYMCVVLVHAFAYRMSQSNIYFNNMFFGFSMKIIFQTDDCENNLFQSFHIKHLKNKILY